MTTGNATATVGGVVVAETTEWEVVEGNVYFPPSALKREFFVDTDLHTTCSWKGEASYYTINVGGASNLPCFSNFCLGLSFVAIRAGKKPTPQRSRFADASRSSRQDARQRGMVLPNAQRCC
jgi:hypothetical protein